MHVFSNLPNNILMLAGIRNHGRRRPANIQNMNKFLWCTRVLDVRSSCHQLLCLCATTTTTFRIDIEFIRRVTQTKSIEIIENERKTVFPVMPEIHFSEARAYTAFLCEYFFHLCFSRYSILNGCRDNDVPNEHCIRTSSSYQPSFSIQCSALWHSKVRIQCKISLHARQNNEHHLWRSLAFVPMQHNITRDVLGCHRWQIYEWSAINKTAILTIWNRDYRDPI